MLPSLPIANIVPYKHYLIIFFNQIDSSFRLSQWCSRGLCSGMACHLAVWLVLDVQNQHGVLIFKGWHTSTFEDETTMLSEYVGLQTPSDTVPYPRRTKISKLIHFYKSKNELFNSGTNSFSVCRVINII